MKVIFVFKDKNHEHTFSDDGQNGGFAEGYL